MPKLTCPNFIIHYNRGEPFRSITSTPQDQWKNIVQNLNSTNAWGLNRFTDPAYLKQRIALDSIPSRPAVVAFAMITLYLHNKHVKQGV